MTLMLVALALLLGGGAGALLLSRSARASTLLGAGGAIAGSVLGLVPAVRALVAPAPLDLQRPWGLYGTLHLALDPLTGFFLVPVFVLGAVSALYGVRYLQAHGPTQAHGTSWLSYDVLVASMALVTLARDGLLFLVAWETMALSSFFLVTSDHQREGSRQAGWTYLIATHLGTAFLLPLFLVLAERTGSLDFDTWQAAGTPPHAGLLFVLAVVGFGTKAGIVPLHVWLPEAHPAAPSHVSALMSGVMIKTGIYGLVRMLAFLGPPATWWGWLLVVVGLASGLLGVLFALAQHDLKRLLAYHSVENIGIIVMGLGLGLLGVSSHRPALAALGFAGALLHVVNHALFKGLLFLGAGAVLQQAHTGDIDELGGLLRRMPRTGLAFLVGAVAIAGLPPLNGFISELLVYLGALGAVRQGGVPVAVPAVAAVVGLALIGGLATACFTKAFGVVFLGEPRSAHGHEAHDPPASMQLAMGLLVAGCLAVALLAPALLRPLGAVVAAPAGLSRAQVLPHLAGALGTMRAVVAATLALATLVVLLAALRSALLARRTVTVQGTWDCGYVRPTARMQYSASSFADPVTTLFHGVLRTHVEGRAPAGYFPGAARLATHTPDLFRESLFRPLFVAVRRALAGLRWLQSGGVHRYVLYLALTLVALLVWKL